MWTIAGILVIAAFCFLIEIPSLKKFKKDLWTFCMMMLVAISLSIVSARHVPISNPLDWAAAVFEPIGESMKKAFE
ncbi:hypothetical protein H8B09_27520 [Paenibacillus sp. PR3]|uniref:Uncharacterized protein n=1 Tax=Paenibacillus terricola TaxID=2763503 RepID=A0ABR8N2Z3_9BACL|nr:hypothetical protein [Paenibacillus terricola]MBD3922533.1 hypothetical protein [Paenibacillus terricola]